MGDMTLPKIKLSLTIFCLDLEQFLNAIALDDSTILIHQICNNVIGVVNMTCEKPGCEIGTNHSLWFKPTEKNVDYIIGNTVMKRKYRTIRNESCKVGKNCC